MKNRILIGLTAVLLLFTAISVSAASPEGVPDLHGIGKEAVRAAFVRLGLDAPTSEVACLTNAGWTRLGEVSTRPLFDVLASTAGTTTGKSNLISVHSSVDAPLWFVFAHKRSKDELLATDIRINGADVEASEPINIHTEKHRSFDLFKQVFGERAFAVVTLLKRMGGRRSGRDTACGRLPRPLLCRSGERALHGGVHSKTPAVE